MAKGTKKKSVETAESMARRQRDISVSEFFLKNRHLLGFDSPSKALLTAVKEAVDNALDACEEAHILPCSQCQGHERILSSDAQWGNIIIGSRCQRIQTVLGPT